jgi:Putative DNA-binding domain
VKSGLAELHELLYRLITAPCGVAAVISDEGACGAGGLEAIIAGNKRLSAYERLEIYANAYFYRLRDIFQEDFSCLHAVLGETAFHNLITGYLIEFPPSDPSVLGAGRNLARYVESKVPPVSSVISHLPFVADLARLERACIEVFHGADARPLEQESLRNLTAEAWPVLRVRLHPAAQILDVDWRVDRLMTAINDGRQWELPEPESATLLVWRKEWQVRYRALETGERAALKTAAGGVDFASMCAAFAGQFEGSAASVDLAATINRTLSGWLADGILAGEAA